MKKLLLRVLFFSLFVWLLFCLGLLLIIHQTGIQDEAENADVIIVLGAGLNRSGNAGPALTRRSEHAAELWHAGYAPYIICTGGVGRNQSRSEAEGCKDILLREGVDESVIFLEATSRSTEENALNSQIIMQDNNWQSALIVSDSYHVFRANYIFTSRGIHVSLSPVQYERIRSRGFYVSSLFREIAALHWQVFKDVFNIPVTYVPIG